MRNFLRLLNRFKSDERGAFLVLFGVLAIVLVATSGAVVDFTTLEQARTRAQDALDSASLGLQPTIFRPGVTEDTILPIAQNLVDERLANDNVTATVTGVTIDVSDGMLRLQASINVPMAFVALVGVTEINAGILSEATRKRLSVEVAMVLDNSGSMASSSRMTHLKAAATCAANILLNDDCNSVAVETTVNAVTIGIVPFTEFVNVGTGYRYASWMDQTGTSSISNDNFDVDDRDTTVFTGTVNRWTLYDQLANVSWQGCVEARPYPYDTNDTTPDPANPDTLFVPEFAPDTPSGYTNNYISDSHLSCRQPPTWRRTQTKENCTQSGGNSSNWSNCGSPTQDSYAQTNEWGASVNPAATSQPADFSAASYYNQAGCSGWGNYTSVRTSQGPSRYRYTRSMTCTYNFSDRELQERICKYHGNISTSGGKGPNWDCPTNAMLPLTSSKPAVMAAITAMYPQGYTNIHQGAIWGLHMLTSNEPLTEGRPFEDANYKVMIIMTDGENTVDGYSSSNMNRANGYMAYGYPGSPSQGYNGRIYSSTYPNPTSDGQVTASMNQRAVQTCASAKALGITVYTIGLSAPNQTTRDMLTACATTNHDYFPNNPSELTAVFAEIASQLADLRLAK